MTKAVGSGASRSACVVRRISEQLQNDTEVMSVLRRVGVLPGNDVLVSQGHDGVIVARQGETAEIDTDLAQHVFVSACDASAVAELGPGAGLGGLDLAVLRRRGGHEGVEQPLGGDADLVHGPVERLGVRLAGLVEPLTLRTYCSAAACTSSEVAGGSKLWSWRMLRHMEPAYAGEITG